CVFHAILLAIRIPRIRVAREVMIELRQLLEGRGTWLAVVHDVRDEPCRISRLEPIVFAVEHEHRRVHAGPRTSPVLLLRLLVKRERSTVVTGVARADDAAPD